MVVPRILEHLTDRCDGFFHFLKLKIKVRWSFLNIFANLNRVLSSMQELLGSFIVLYTRLEWQNNFGFLIFFLQRSSYELLVFSYLICRVKSVVWSIWKKVMLAAGCIARQNWRWRSSAVSSFNEVCLWVSLEKNSECHVGTWGATKATSRNPKRLKTCCFWQRMVGHSAHAVREMNDAWV